MPLTERLARLLIILLLGLAATASRCHAQGQDDTVVVEALQKVAPPWYDPQADDWRRLKPPERPPAPPKSTGTSFYLGPLAAGAMWILLGLVVGLLAFGIYTSLTRRENTAEEVRPSGTSPAPSVRHLPMGLGRTQQDPETALREARQRNDWPAVCLWAYAAALLRLDAADRIRLRAGMTNRACLRSLQEQKELFRELMELCESVHFGRYPADSHDAERALDHLESLSRPRRQSGGGGVAAKAVALLLCLALVHVAGCRKGLETSYGTTRERSINGISVIQQIAIESLHATLNSGLGEHLDEKDGIVHVSLQPGLPDDDQAAYISDWLTNADGRTCVLILRGDSVTPPLCTRWGDQASAIASERAGTSREKELRHAAETFYTIAHLARQEEMRYTAAESYSWYLDLYLNPAKPTSQGRLQGSERLPLPPGFAVTGHASNAFDMDDESWEVLATLDERPLIIERPFGESRLIVVLNSTLFLDGAMPDPVARQLLLAFTEYLRRQTPTDWVMLSSLRRWDGEISHPNMLDLLFRRPPFNLIFIHLLLIGIAFAGSRALWLGRRIDPDFDPHPPFSRHITAFATWLKRCRGHRFALKQLATLLDTRPPEGSLSEEEALAAARSMLSEAYNKRPPTKPLTPRRHSGD